MAEGKKYKIVYIEDDIDMVKIVEVILRRGNFELISVAEGHEGLDLVRKEKPDLVLLDIMLPDMGGWAVYQKMKAEKELSAIPVIVVTAQDAAIDRILGEHIAKVQVYITKPFSPKKLLSSINDVLGIEAQE